jgi:hypothetical protein
MTCIDTKTGNRDVTAAACTSETYSGESGQGAPIVVTKIEPEILVQADYVRPQFKIYIENKGTGYVTNAKSCQLTNINDQDTSGRVNVRAQLSGEELKCGPDESGQLRLVDSESFIRCYLPSDNSKYSRTKKNYLTTLTVSIDYTYTLINKQEVEIKHNDLLKDTVTQGLCNSYQVEDTTGQCVSRCEYCSRNPTDALCQDNKPYPGFTFGQGFTCSCTLQQCDEKKGKGSCIKGYCPGDLYCCSTLQCDDYQVEVNGQCIDKCDYCSKINSSDTTICQTGTGFDFTGFTCVPMLEQNCTDYAAKGSACIKGYCGGPNKAVMYCASRDKIRSILANQTTTSLTGTGYLILNTENDIGSSTSKSRCEYCANNASSPYTSCTFTNNGVVGRVIDGFSCTCTGADISSLKNYNFVPDKSFCNNEMYCCNKD